jgi:hypothetical protein
MALALHDQEAEETFTHRRAPMMPQEAAKKEAKKNNPAGSDAKPPKGKVRCFISKQVYDEEDTVELDYNGVIVRVHKRYART